MTEQQVLDALKWKRYFALIPCADNKGKWHWLKWLYRRKIYVFPYYDESAFYYEWSLPEDLGTLLETADKELG